MPSALVFSECSWQSPCRGDYEKSTSGRRWGFHPIVFSDEWVVQGLLGGLDLKRDVSPCFFQEDKIEVFPISIGQAPELAGSDFDCSGNVLQGIEEVLVDCLQRAVLGWACEHSVQGEGIFGEGIRNFVNLPEHQEIVDYIWISLEPAYAMDEH